MSLPGPGAAAWLRAADLPHRWQGLAACAVFDTAFGDGERFVATWAAWRRDPRRSARLDYLAIEYPLAPAPLPGTAASWLLSDPTLAEPVAELQAAWPPDTPDLHRLVFDHGRVQLLLARGGPSRWWRQLGGSVDTCFVDATAAQVGPGLAPLGKLLARLSAPGARVVGDAWLSALPAALRAAGFEAVQAPGGDPPSGLLTAVHAPAFATRRPPARQPARLDGAAREVIVVGAGLAGCAVSAALARQGWQVRLIDRHAGPAEATSGNPAGIFHGVVHAQHGAHARFIRACAMETTRQLRHRFEADAADGGAAPWGAMQGLLRLETALPPAAMRSMLTRLHLPDAHVQALDADAASALAGLPLDSAAWFYPGGGWLRPAALAQRWLADAGPACRWIGQREVASLRREAGHWQAFDLQGDLVAHAPVLVLANADEAHRLLGPTAWPCSAVRGQLSVLDAAARHGIELPRLPLTGAGYLLPAVEGRAVFGATSQPGDTDPSVRIADHRLNLDRLAQLSPALARSAARLPEAALGGRTAWRCVSPDRLPLIGEVPAAWMAGATQVEGVETELPEALARGSIDQARRVPRVPGLYLFAGLGSRGITVAALGGELLASLIGGAPLPLGADLVDAVDPARFLTRATRRAAASRGPAGGVG